MRLTCNCHTSDRRHITNSSFQKLHGKYDLSAESTPDIPVGNKWHIDAVRREWRRQGKDDRAVWARIEDALTRVFLMFEGKGYAESSKYVKYRGNCFCLFGVDVLLDEQMQPWVLELNGVPSTGTDSPLDIRSFHACEYLCVCVCVCVCVCTCVSCLRSGPLCGYACVLACVLRVHL